MAITISRTRAQILSFAQFNRHNLHVEHNFFYTSKKYMIAFIILQVINIVLNNQKECMVPCTMHKMPDKIKEKKRPLKSRSTSSPMPVIYIS